MKTINAITTDIRSRLSDKWHTDLVNADTASANLAAADLVAGNAAFPHAFPLGHPDAAILQKDYAPVLAWTINLQDWSRQTDVHLYYKNREAKGRSKQLVPTHALVRSIDHAAAIVAGDWPDRLERARARLAVLRERYPEVLDMARLVRLIDKYSDVDFELLLTVAYWFREDPSRAFLGVTPRQVPIPGVHAKWLQSHQSGVRALTGLQSLGLLPEHPARINFTYLDPAYRATGARFHDSATVGDAFAPPYKPAVIIISENKDTAIHFLPLPGAISIEGVGKGGKTIATFSWIRDAQTVVYWGDMDRDGFEILDGYRIDFDRDIGSILMDPETYCEYEQFGTDLDKNNKPIKVGNPRPVGALHADERSVYLRVVNVLGTGHRRIEQERIPLARAREAVQRVGLLSE